MAEFWQSFGRVLAEFWQSFGKVLAEFWHRFGRVWGKSLDKSLADLWQCFCRVLSASLHDLVRGSLSETSWPGQTTSLNHAPSDWTRLLRSLESENISNNL